MNCSRKCITLSLFSILCTTLLPPPSASAAEATDVIKMVPDDAWVVVVVRSLAAIDKKADQLNKLFDLGLPTPATASVLGLLNVGDAVDMTHPFCFVLLDVQKFGVAGPAGAVVLLVPAKDPKALIKKLSPPESESQTGEKTQGDGNSTPGEKKNKPSAKGIHTISIMGQTSYAAIKGNYVLLSQNEDSVTKVAKTKKTLDKHLEKARVSVLGKSDLYLSVAWGAVFDAYKDMVMPMFQMATAASDPEGKNTQKLIKLLSEIASIDISFSLDRDGAALRFLVTAKKDSDLKGLLKDAKNDNKSLLSALPKEKYLIAYGSTGGYSEHGTEFGQTNWLSTVLNTLQIEGINEDVVKSLDEIVLNLSKLAGKWAVSLAALPKGESSMFGIAFVLESKDPKAYHKDVRKLYDAIWTVTDDEDFGEMKNSVILSKDAETIAGVKVDTLTVKLDAMADRFSFDKDDLKNVKSIVGENVVFRFGPVDDHHFVCSFGGGAERFARLCKSITSSHSGSLSEDKGITAVSSRMIHPHSAEGYLAVDSIMQAVKSIAKIMGEEDDIPFDVPQIDTPIALGSAQIGDVAQAEVYVPMKVITAIKKGIEEQMKAEMKDFDEDEDEDEDGDDESDSDNDGD